jgi:hypothetical protein
MGRIRTNENADLPEHTYFKHGSYWFVHKGKWSRLDADKDIAIRKAKRLNDLYDMKIEEGPYLLNALRKSFIGRKGNAIKKSIKFSVTFDDVVEIAERQHWKCAVTGVPLEMTPHTCGNKRPFAPSIDRIKPADGYTIGNIRVVAMAVNFAMNEWGDSIIQLLAEGWLRKKFKDSIGQPLDYW